MAQGEKSRDQKTGEVESHQHHHHPPVSHYGGGGEPHQGGHHSQEVDRWADPAEQGEAGETEEFGHGEGAASKDDLEQKPVKLQ